LEGKRFTWQREDGDTGTGTIVEPGKPIEKPAAIFAQAARPIAPQKAAAKKVEIAVAVNVPKARPKSELIAAKPAARQQPQTAVAAATPEIASKHAEAPTTVAFHVPEPRMAVRPKRSAKVAVASVKPQFFTSPKTVTANIESSARKPFRVAGVDPSDVLNIRNGPSPAYESVGGIPPDSHGITITGPCLNDWCPVKHRTLIGWVNRRFLAEETADTSAADLPNYWDATP
jgi:hypothetical protein